MSLVSLLERAGLPANQFACPQPELSGHMLYIAPGALACPGTLAMGIGHPANAWRCSLTIFAMHGCSIVNARTATAPVELARACAGVGKVTCVFDLEGYGASETVMPPFQARLPHCAKDASALHPDALALQHLICMTS